MKKFSIYCIALVAVVFFVSESFAAVGNAGCGLGHVIFKGDTGKTMQILAATTNGTSGNQTFGITSGTSGCDEAGNVVYNEKVENFVAKNMDNLASDMAKGSGEYLTTLAVLLEVKEGNRASFNTKLQSNFSKIFTSEKVTSKEVVANINDVVS